MLGPLQQRLRDAERRQPASRRAVAATSRPRSRRARRAATATSRPAQRAAQLASARSSLRDQTDGARVLVTDARRSRPTRRRGRRPASSTTRDFAADRRAAAALALAADARCSETRDRASTATTLRVARAALRRRRASPASLVAQRRADRGRRPRSTQVRNALLRRRGDRPRGRGRARRSRSSSTLLRRLGRLRAAALRITAEGPDAPDAARHAAATRSATSPARSRRMQEELRRQEAARRSFVATASHELRTPLTMLQGTMELLEEDLRDGRLDLEPTRSEQVANARARAAAALRAGRASCSTSRGSTPPCSCAPSRSSSASSRAPSRPSSSCAPRERDVALEVVPPDGPCWGRGDPDAVARVVRILLDNALRYAPARRADRASAPTRGDGRVDVARRRPRARASRRRSASTSSSASTAAAAPASESGFGLGLAIGRELAERMGGDARARRTPTARGARFVLDAAAPASAGLHQHRRLHRIRPRRRRSSVGWIAGRPCKPRVVGEVLRPLLRAHPDERRPRRAPAVERRR